ncbi:MAG TPA: hypothetical protein VI385_15985 [Flavisolibacter sp.]
MNWNDLLGVVCVVSFTIPIVIVLYNRYYTHRSLTALLLYYSIVFTDNLVSNYVVPATSKVAWLINLVDNYVYVPLMLTALLFFCASKQKQQKIRLLTLIFLAYEVVIIGIFGFSFNSVIYITGPGVAIILIYSFYLFVRQVKFSIFHGKNHGRVLMLAAIVFDSSCYSIIFFFNYIEKTPYQNDVFKLYYISSIISSVLMAIGLQLMNKRMKELRAIKITRRELAMIFNQ